ncbi:hypothetical protein ACQJBY_032672 [Aegilops geniculata]
MHERKVSLHDDKELDVNINKSKLMRHMIISHKQPGRHRPPRWLTAMPSRHPIYDTSGEMGGIFLACRHTGTTHTIQPEGYVHQA